MNDHEQLKSESIFFGQLMKDKPIGGYFELELPSENPPIYANAHNFQSARSAFYALLLSLKPEKVWMPYYICDSMIAPLTAAGVEIGYYSLNSDFSIKNDIDLKKSEWLFYVNYFGICGSQQQKILEKYNCLQVVFDHSQAFFQKPLECLATIYSPRKFFGVPDGGLVITNQNILTPEDVDQASITRSAHLLKRLGSTPESGYSDFIESEKSLMELTPKKMSLFTQRILASIAYDNCRKKRNVNFKFIHNRLAEKNELSHIIDIEDLNGPMIYPFLSNDPNLKKTLIENRIYVPTYWPECERHVCTKSYEKKLVAFLVPIPCDHRYTESDLCRIFNLL